MSILIFAFVSVTLATKGVDVSEHDKISTFQCFKNNGIKFAVIRAFRSTGKVDTNSVHTVYNAWAGGMSNVDIYMFPCPKCGNPKQQMQECINYQKQYNTTYGKLWIDVEGTQYWKDQAYNRQFFLGLVNEAKALGVHLGVYTSKSQWGPIMGVSWTGGSAYPLWYAHYDNNPSFSDFASFGGWSKPAIKQYQGDVSLCGASVDRDWSP